MNSEKVKLQENAPHFENDTEKEMGIETVDYPNGNRTKQLTLSTGQKAVVRELFGRDNKELIRRAAGDIDNYQNAQLSIAVTLDGQRLIIEDIDAMKQKDLSKLMVANAALNF